MVRKRQLILDDLKPSLGQAKEYASFFEGLVDEMNKDIQAAVLPKAESVAMDSEIGNLVESSLDSLLDKWVKRFDKLGDDWAGRIVREQSASAQSKMRRQARKLKAPASLTFSAGPLTRRKLQERSKEISKLIKSIPSDYINDFQEMIGGYGVATPKISVIHEMLDSRYKKHKNKAKNLMLDQTRKTFQGLTESRAKDSGQSKYIWRHTGGSQDPRSYHKFVLNGKTFSYDDPPVIDLRTGERGNPGDAINCKCQAKVIVEF